MVKNNTDYNEYIPKISLRRFVQALLSEEVMGNKTEAERVTGVRRQYFYYEYNHNPDFRAWFSKECDNFLGINESLPARKLLEKIQSGNVQAIRTYYELRDKIKAPNISLTQNNQVNVKTEKIYVFTNERDEYEKHRKDAIDVRRQRRNVRVHPEKIRRSSKAEEKV